jgi:hypothetical protein
VKDLEEALKQAKAERTELSETVDKLRQKVLEKRSANEFSLASNA